MRRAVLAGVDGSPGSLAAARWAAWEAERRGVGLSLLHAAPVLRDPAVPAPALNTLHEVGELMLQRVAACLRDRHPRIEIQSEQVDRACTAALLAGAEAAELLVVGTRGSGGFDGLAVGSTALSVAAGAAVCPVVLVPRPSDTGGEQASTWSDHGQVVVGFHPPCAGAETVEFAFLAAEARGGSLLAVQAWALPADSVSARTPFVAEEDRAEWEDQELFGLSEALRAWSEKYPQVDVTADVVLLHPAQALLNASRTAALLVVGSRTDPEASEGRLGPVTHAVLHHARCPVAVVPYSA